MRTGGEKTKKQREDEVSISSPTQFRHANLVLSNADTGHALFPFFQHPFFFWKMYSLLSLSVCDCMRAYVWMSVFPESNLKAGRSTLCEVRRIHGRLPPTRVTSRPPQLAPPLLLPPGPRVRHLFSPSQSIMVACFAHSTLTIDRFLTPFVSSSDCRCRAAHGAGEASFRDALAVLAWTERHSQELTPDPRQGT